jgi:outer membrane protein with beta-barrel domain
MRKAGLLVVLVPVLAAVPAAARASQGGGEIHGAYSILHDNDSDETFSSGLLVGVGFSVSREVSVIGEFSRHSKDFKSGNLNVLNVSVKTYMGGLRFGRGFYAQFLVGGVSGSVGLFGLTASSKSYFGIQPGVGVDLPLTDVVSLRVGGDYRLVFAEDKNSGEWRGHVGIAFHLGRR